MTLVTVKALYGAWEIRGEVSPGDEYSSSVAEQMEVRPVDWPAGDAGGWRDPIDYDIDAMRRLSMSQALESACDRQQRRSA